MTFKYPVLLTNEVDIDELIERLETDPKIINWCHKTFTDAEYNLIYFILREGLIDILGQKPVIPLPDEDEDDPYARPGIETPNLDPDDPADEDPYARPVGWDPSSGVFWDAEKSALVDGEGNIIKVVTPEENPYWQDWVRYWLKKYPGNINIPHMPTEPTNPELEDFQNYLQETYGDNGAIANDDDL